MEYEIQMILILANPNAMYTFGAKLWACARDPHQRNPKLQLHLKILQQISSISHTFRGYHHTINICINPLSIDNPLSALGMKFLLGPIGHPKTEAYQKNARNFSGSRALYDVTSSIYGSRSYMKWRYGGVRHGTSAGKRRDIAFGVLALLG